MIDFLRRARETTRLELLLNALLYPSIEWTGFREVGTSNHEWVLLPNKAETAVWKVAYCQRFYDYEGLKLVDEDFTPADHLPALSLVDPQEYHDVLQGGAGDPLKLPIDLALSIDRFMDLLPSIRDRFSNACYWLGQANRTISFSLMFLAAIQAIETLVQPVRGTECPECGLMMGPSRTDLFVSFLEQYAPSATGDDPCRRALYRVRSGLTHGFNPPFRTDLEMTGMNPKGLEERQYVLNALKSAKIAMRNWLHADHHRN